MKTTNAKKSLKLKKSKNRVGGQIRQRERREGTEQKTMANGRRAWEGKKKKKNQVGIKYEKKET